jgi:ribonuclease BN (tRNA processing enzyme)
LRLAFLGTGAAFSTERYNGAVVVDGRILLDGGAPVLPHLHRLGIDPGGIRALFLTHLHGDHVLGLPPFFLSRAFRPPGTPLVAVGPPATEEVMERLLTLAWGQSWDALRGPADVRYEVAQECGEVAGVPYRSVKLDHGEMDCRGYRLEVDGRLLAYAGDTIASQPLDELVSGVEIAITEATGLQAGPTHTSWAEAEALAARHPNTLFLFNHLHEGDLARAVHDLEVLDV